MHSRTTGPIRSRVAAYRGRRTLCGMTVALTLLAVPRVVTAKEYLLTAVKPNSLVLVDPAARAVERVYPVPGPGIYQTIVASPDGSVAYFLTNGWESISGIDLGNGKEVFRANLSEPGLRVKCMWGIVPSPDGKELFVYELPVKLHPDWFEVQDTRIVVYRTADGTDAKPIRTFKAPRRIGVLAMSADGKRLYACGYDLYAMDPGTGAILETYKIKNWNRPGFDSPDAITIWPNFEQTGVLTFAYFAARTGMAPDAPGAFAIGLWMLDLKTGAFQMKDFQQTPELLFSAVLNPVRRHEAYIVSTVLKRISLERGTVLKEVELDHDYWMANVSGDGKEVYVGGNMADISVYASDTLERIGTIEMPDGAFQVQATMRVVRR